MLVTLRPFLLVLAALVVGAGVGFVAGSEKSLSEISWEIRQRLGVGGSGAETPGHWGRYQGTDDLARLSPEQAEEVRRLRSLGYAGGTVKAGSGGGVTAHQPELASRGLRFYTSGHEPAAYLMDASGKILHTWRLTYEDCIAASGRPAAEFLPDPQDVTSCWRRAHLFPDGRMLAIFEGHGLALIDRDSNLIWCYPGASHHDLEVMPDGSIYVLTRATEFVPGIREGKPVLVDYITHLSADGQELGKINLLKAFRESVFSSWLNHLPDAGDIFHTNTLEVLDGSAAHRSPIFAAGNFLISVRELDLVAIVDHRTEKVVWALGGMWTAQHQSTLLDNGNLMVFDNQGHGGRSKVVEIDPLTQEVVWSYADGPAHPLYSKTCGSNQRLPNGNTLITESDNGRALEVTPEGLIVWEFRNPRRTGKDNEFIAAIFEMVILPDDFQPEWLAPAP